MDFIAIIITITFGFSIILLFISLFYAVIKRSWKAMLISCIASLPISMYFLSGNPPISFIGFVPLLFFALTVIFRRASQKEVV